MAYERVLEKVGSFGWYQKKLYILIFLAGIPNAFPNLMFTFTQYIPNFHCAPPRMDGIMKNSTEYEEFLNYTIPWEKNDDGQMERSRCEMYERNLTNYFSNLTDFTPGEVVPCTNGWIYENNFTVIAQFDLVCQHSWKPPLATSLYMVGMGLAAFSGKLSDRFGRRPLFLFFTFAQFILTGITGLAWSFEVYAFLVLVVGMSGLVNYVVAYVLATEVIGVEKQTGMAILCTSAYATGYIISPLLGYLFPYWRWYLWSNALIGILYIPLFWVFPESLRWLLVSGREKEAKKAINEIATANGRTVDADAIYNEFKQTEYDSEDKSALIEKTKSIDVEKESSYLHMMRNPTMFFRMLVCYLSWFITSMVYFAITLNPAHLSGNRLINIFLAGIVEFPAFALSYISLRRLGRSRSCFLYLSIAGISCCIAPFLSSVSPDVVTFFVLVGKGSITAVFNMVYVVIAEISPTMVRTTSMGVASACARLGGIVMPYLMFAGTTSGDRFIPYVVMGTISLLVGVLSLFVIPETNNMSMPDTLHEALSNKRVYGFKLWRSFEKKENEDSIVIS